ncbi:DUF4198 domain-containing protein [Terasakiella sp. A23]|uniref:DUF4198 domain-containing protein n=1 Tax=Terasakiella sp. FCG-A23 TaxID=3080561 RepID=UPI002953929F|nr:DUF4198 domain-containing protein [Terasakiella sp. A23]MDV7338919.1 DUF4198 domain-containing protein [Terasakiella sp. A23]
MTNKFLALFVLATFLFTTPAFAHFVELTADKNFLNVDNGKTVSLEMTFTHPFEGGPLMTMVRPQNFGMLHRGKKADLTQDLKSVSGFENLKWQISQKLNRLGDYIFYVTPKPYFEPVENKFIVHYTKTVISHGNGDGWDDLVGSPVEIRPLSKPYGLWTYNLFRGVVLHNGKPVPYAEIEVEHKNEQKIAAPNDSYVTQVIKADGNGVFAYSLPKAGWWGFAALIDDGETMKGADGKDYAVEKGALIWVMAEDMK